MAVNQAGVVPIGAKNRSSQIVTTILTPAGTPGAKYPISQAGDNFYIVLATGVVTVRPNRGVVNNFSQGTGLSTPDAPFDYIEIGNPSTTENLVVSIFVGFGGYIDNRLIVQDPLVSQVTYPTFPVPNVANFATVTDRSRLAITDANGENYIALRRVALYVFNLELATSYYVFNAASTARVAVCAPPLAITFPSAGDFVVADGAGGSAPLNAVISEIYEVVRPTLGI